MSNKLIFLAAVLFSPHLLAQVIVGGPLAPDNLEARFTAPPPISTLSGLQAHLGHVGDLTFRNATLVLPDSPSGPRVYVVAARNLRFANSRIITNGNKLEIFAEEIDADSASSIMSFTTRNALPPSSPLPETRDGPSGIAGRNAGDVTIHVIQDFRDKLTLELSGQDGQPGTSGQRGSTGSRGATGRSGKCGTAGVGCRSGPGDGGNGGPGGTGGRGGNGGAGGNGGNIVIVFFNKDPSETNLPVYSNDGGRPGAAGQGGAGGAGGPGGDKGNRGPCCRRNAAHNGAQGPNGSAGPSGNHGTHGAKGRFVSRRQDIPV